MAETFSQLENAIRGIQRSLDKIVSIVDQTNILAINASIEAARADAEGRSFAVVAAENAVSVQVGIAGVIERSQQELQTLCQFFDQIKDQYQEVVKHISSASRLGTTKSTMFADMDNMLSQITPLVRDLERRS